MLNAATRAALPSQCFDDPAQQNQVTALDGFYKFDLNFSDASCPAAAAYLIEVTPLTTGYLPSPSRIIPPTCDANHGAVLDPGLPGQRERCSAVHRRVLRGHRRPRQRRRCRSSRARPARSIICTCC